MPINSIFIVAELGLSAIGFWTVHRCDHGAQNWIIGLAALVLFSHAVSMTLSAF